MKLIRFGARGEERPGVELESGDRKDCSQYFEDWNHEFFANEGLARLAELLKDKGDSLPQVSVNERVGCPVARPGKLIGIGLNFSDHAAESGMEPPTEPILFMKATSAIVGPYDEVRIPRGSEKTDWEVELGVVIGADASYLDSPDESQNHIAGYCVINDVSERAFQLERGGQWSKGKCCDTFAPIGPWMVTRDEVAEPGNLSMTLDINGERKQDGNSKTMIFTPEYLIYYLSQFMTLEAGDVITTGTPPGVGMGQKPPRYLSPGDVIELAIEGLGAQRQVCGSA